MRPVVTNGVVVLLVTCMSVDLSVVMQIAPRIKVTFAGIVWKGSSDFAYILRLWGYLWLMEVVALNVPVARFEKAVGYDSMNSKLTEGCNRFANAQVVSQSSEGKREKEG